MQYTQNNAPIYEALMKYNEARVVPFDVPGHKHGKGNPLLTEFLGQTCMSVDVNSMKPLDNLCHPVSVIRDAERLAAEAFGAGHCFFMVNGTTSSVQSMILSVCKEGDKIIIPRNVHRSAINAMIVSGVVPVYVNPGVNHKLGIPLGMSVKDVEQAIIDNPDAKAVFVNNPTYYGIHKTGGSLTQSSFLLVGKNAGISEGHVRAIINLTQTTSGSYLLLSSLDIARKYYATQGRELCAQVVKSAEYARTEINKIGGYYAYSDELVNGDDIFAFDKTKLSIYTRDIGLAGIEVYDILRDSYDIQMELGDIGNVLAIMSPGDRWKDIERLVSALSEIKRRFGKESAGHVDHEYINPKIMLSPKAAFYGEQEVLPIMESAGRISCEFVMCYPPGIPIIAPGELLTPEILENIDYSKKRGCFMTGTEDMNIEKIRVIKE